MYLEGLRGTVDGETVLSQKSRQTGLQQSQLSSSWQRNGDGVQDPSFLWMNAPHAYRENCLKDYDRAKFCNEDKNASLGYRVESK